MSGGGEKIFGMIALLVAIPMGINYWLKNPAPNPAYEGRPFFELYDRGRAWITSSPEATPEAKPEAKPVEAEKAKPVEKSAKVEKHDPPKPKPKPVEKPASAAEWDAINADLDRKLGH